MSGRRRGDASGEDGAALSLAHSERLRRWHQQQASQIELDLQQQALAEQQSWQMLAIGRTDYAALYEQAPAGYLSLDAGGCIVRANLAAAALLGRRRAELPGQCLPGFFDAPARERLREFIAATLAGAAPGALELLLGGRQVRIEANLDQPAQRCRMILTDMGTTAVREAARRRAFEVLDHMAEGVLVCDAARRIVSVNPAFVRLTGYAAEDVLGRRTGFLIAAQAAPAWRGALRGLRQAPRWEGELSGRRRDGSVYAGMVSLSVVRDGDGGVHYIGVFSDITARRQAENSQRLALHLERRKEQERERIARDIHDELGQNLLALRIDVAMLAERSGARHPRLHQRARAALQNVDATIRSVRGIMNDLRPAVLDLGLCAALEWQVAEFRRDSGLRCTLSLPPEAALPPLPAAMEIALFRSLQEALLNIRRHAHASAVAVQLLLPAGGLAFSVTDDGVGLAPGARAKPDAFGLIGMEQRVGALGGRLTMESALAGGGCRLRLSFDL
ncbi:PAS domain S-box-containing protein [Duganella sp. 1224]|uniref:PAS domain-containing sensor histidine kinase n=1 Tax=Duganella sp. 1224 TaxID=2587052 RepID=UPI0015CB97B0|nr:PAS domain S-box protein [Duganella sp. 1224]NYE59241.1 PAS domain S-box-containing protein [Duganella sp. 1224]